jgi:hypothetical protein
MPRNGYRSSRGRSAVARKVLFSGPGSTDGVQPRVVVQTQNGPVVTSFFGGNKKGGSAPSATGFMVPFGLRSTISSGLGSRNNYLFTFKTNPGVRPYGNTSHL